MTTTEQPKIDLEQIKELANGISQLNSNEDDGVCLCYEDCQTIEGVLEALPKLVETLQNLHNHYNTPIGRRRANEGQLEALQGADYLLSTLFTNQTPQQ